MRKLFFNDGTFILVAETSDTVHVPTGLSDYAFPNYILRDGLGYTITKTDKIGNVWTFHSGSDPSNYDSYIKIQGSGINQTIAVGTAAIPDVYMYLVYDDENRILYFSRHRPGATEENPVIYHEPGYYIRALVVNQSTGASVIFSSVGEMIAKGNEYMLATTHAGYYNISNILPRSGGQAMSSFSATTGWNELSERPLVRDLLVSTAGNETSIQIDLRATMDDPGSYDPYIGGEPDNDPYNQDPGTSGGDFDDGGSDPVGVPSLPTISATDTGFVTLFNPSTSQLKSLANYMWSGLDLNTFKKLFADPMDAILGLSILPVSIPNGGSREVAIGNISTGVSMTVAQKQFIEVDCGSVSVKKESPGSYLDYAPYTKIDLYLPFIGTHALNVDEVMGKTIGVVYHVDILSGGCTAFVKVDGKVLYQFIGACAISIPINGNDWTNSINGVITAAGAIGSMIASGGATAPFAAPVLASTAANSMKPDVEKSGGMSGAGGLMGVKKPYLIIQRPRRHIPDDQNTFIGYPSFNNVLLGNISGFNIIEEIHLEKIHATGDELQEIETLLKRGVIL